MNSPRRRNGQPKVDPTGCGLQREALSWTTMDQRAAKVGAAGDDKRKERTKWRRIWVLPPAPSRLVVDVGAQTEPVMGDAGGLVAT